MFMRCVRLEESPIFVEELHMRLTGVPGADLVDPNAEDIAEAMYKILGQAIKYDEQLVTLEPLDEPSPLDVLLQKHFGERPRTPKGAFMQATTTERATVPEDPW